MYLENRDTSFGNLELKAAGASPHNGIMTLSDAELDLIAGGVDWGAVGNQAVGGAVTGAIGGAAGGAVVGLMAGGVGAGPGALAGGISGGIGGGIAGAGMELWNQLTE